MSSKRLQARLTSARYVTVARLASHELRYHKRGRDGSAKCDALETGDAAHYVLGVVYDICESQKPLLDSYEGLGKGYEEKWVELENDKGESLLATTYYATHIDSSLKPFHWYKEHVLRGAMEFSLCQHYIESFLQIDSLADPDPGRHHLETRIYEGEPDLSFLL